MKLNSSDKSTRICLTRWFTIRRALAVICLLAGIHIQGQTIIQNFEGFADSTALNAVIVNTTANTTVTLGATDGVNGSKALIFQGNNAISPWYSQFTLPVTSFSLAGVQSVTVAMKFISGSGENLKIELLDASGISIVQGPQILTTTISNTSFASYTIGVTNLSSTVASIRFNYDAVSYGAAIVSLDNISVTMLAASTIQDFEAFADSTALNAVIFNSTANTTVTLGATDGVNGSKALIFQGNNGVSPYYSQFTLPVSSFSLAGVQSVTVAMKFISGSGENLKIELLDANGYTVVAQGPQVVTTTILNTGFVTYTIGVTNLSSTVASIRFDYDASGYGTTTVAFDNITALSDPITPPTMFIDNHPIKGLNLFATGTNQYARYNIQTVNTNGYSWIGAAGPVTYSMTITNYPSTNYPYFQSQIFLVANPIGNPTAPDYSEANVIFLQIRNQTNGTCVGAFQYKTNQPNDNSMFNGSGNLGSVTSARSAGTWSLTFTHNTNVTVTAADGATADFILPPGVASLFADPGLAVYFGAMPNTTDNIGQDCVLSHAGITGSASGLDDGFTGAALDVSKWVVSGSNPEGVVQVPPQALYWVGWNLPDTGLGLQSNTNLSNASGWTTFAANPIAFASKKQVLVTTTNLPGNVAGFWRLKK